MARHQERDHLLADVLRRQPLPGLRVRRRQHAVQQVPLAAAGPSPGGDQAVDRAVEVGHVGRVAPGGGAQQQRGERSGHAVQPLRVGQRADHRRDEGVRPVPLEGAEVVSETGPGDRLQGQPGHVARHVHRAPGRHVTVPVVGQPAGDRQHHPVVALHGLPAEPGCQDVVRELPVGLVVVGGEQSVARHGPQVGDAEPDVLGEPGLVGEIGHEPRPPHEHELLAERPSPEDRPQLAREAHRVLQRPVPVGAEHIAEQRQPTRRMRDPAQFGPALLGAPETLRQPGLHGLRRRRHDAISLDPAGD